jgi:TRAP-type C4-dicarboxylate transport system substrate-binding protein
MNLDQWNAISPDDQKAIEQVNAKFFEDVAMGLWDMQNEAALKYAVDEKGMEVIDLSQEEHDLWIKLVEPLQNDFVSQMNAKGLKGQEILDTAKTLAEKYNKEYQ